MQRGKQSYNLKTYRHWALEVVGSFRQRCYSFLALNKSKLMWMMAVCASQLKPDPAVNWFLQVYLLLLPCSRPASVHSCWDEQHVFAAAFCSQHVRRLWWALRRGIEGGWEHGEGSACTGVLRVNTKHWSEGASWSCHQGGSTFCWLNSTYLDSVLGCSVRFQTKLLVCHANRRHPGSVGLSGGLAGP